MTLLVRTPAPHPDESLFGYLVRLAEVNGYRSYETLLRLAGLPTAQVNAVTHSLQLEGIAAIVGRAAAALEPIAYRIEAEDGPRFTLLGHTFSTFHGGLLRINPARHCPACLREEGHISAFWDLRAAVACPIHQCLPVVQCPACEAPVRWTRPGLHRCTCEAELPQRTSSVEDTAVLALMHLIKSRLERRGLEGFDNSVGLPIEWLAQEPLASILQTVRILGTQYLNVHGRPLDDDFTLAEAAATCLADWPRNYARFLAGLRAKTVQADPKRTGLLRYEPFYSAMFRNRPAAETSFLLEEFRRFEDSAPLDSVQAPSVESTAIDTVRGTFARRFKVGPAREVSWTDIDHEATCSATVRAVSPRDASRYLGLPVSVLAVLRRSGVFAATVPLEASASWHVEDVEDFAERVARLPMVRPLEAGIVELTRVMARKISVATKTALVTAILDGRVAVYARIGLGFAGLRLDLDGVSAVLAANVGEKSRGTCTLPAAAARLSLCQSVIPAAIAAGLVDSIDVDGSQRVTNSSLEKFEKSYVSLALLARRLKTTPRPLLRMAAELSITVTKLQRPAHPSPQGIIRKVDEARLTASLVADRRKTPRRSAAETTTKSLKTYLGRLRKRGKDLPRCGQSPNMRAIAAACGFDRSVFTRYPSTNDLVMAFDIAARQDRGIVAPCDALRTYLGELRSRGEPLPVRNGRPNVLAIARACGVDRTRFYDDHSLRDLLEAAAIA